MKSDHFKVKQPCDFTKRSESSKQSILSPAEVEDLCFRSLASRAVHHRGVGGGQHSSPGITHLLPPTIEHAVLTSHG